MNVLSLFDGISCAYLSLQRAGIEVKNYYASEIDKYAIQVSKKNFPNIIQLGDVRNITDKYLLTLPNIDLIIGGSPCQDLSIAKKERKGLEGNRSSLFFEYVRILREIKPKYFIFENVASMPKKDKDIISKELGVEPILFNASLVSAQCRKRLFWTNIKFELPQDKGIVLQDILEDARVDDRMITKDKKAFCLDASYYKGSSPEHTIEKKQRTLVLLNKPKEHSFIQIGYFGAKNSCGVGGQALRVYDTAGKSTTSGVGLYKIDQNIRKLTPIECERLQGLPDNYTEGISNTQRYKCIGNAFNVDVVAHILRKNLPHKILP